MEPATGTDTFVFDADALPRREKGGGRVRRTAQAVATFFLAGLTTAEILAGALAYLAGMAFLWASHTVQPERLLTEPAFRSAWMFVVLALARPVTWIPFVLPFVGLRKLFEILVPRWRPILRNGLGLLLTLVIMAGAVWLVVVSIERAGTAILSGLAFVTGSGSFATLGAFRGDWTDGRIGLVVGAVVLLRLFLPPLGRDLDLAGQPVLGFWRGSRGAFDRWLVLAVAIGAAITGGTALFLALRA